jgi:hypothetical protein
VGGGSGGFECVDGRAREKNWPSAALAQTGLHYSELNRKATTTCATYIFRRETRFKFLAVFVFSLKKNIECLFGKSLRIFIF